MGFEIKGIKGRKGEKNKKSARPDRGRYVSLQDSFSQEKPEQESLSEHSSADHSKRVKGLKVAGLVLGAAATVGLTAFGVVSYYYSEHFFRGTVINGIDCSNKTAYEAEQMIRQEVEDYSIRVSSRNLEDEVIDGSSINYQYAPVGEVLELLKEQKPYEWLGGLNEKKEYNITVRTTFDRQLLEEQVLSLACTKEENQIEPEDAYISFQDGQFEIIPETEGSEIMLKGAYLAVNEAISADLSEIDLGTSEQAYVQASVTSEDPDLLETRDAYNHLANASITYTFGDSTEVLDKSVIQNWLKFDEKGQLLQDDGTFQQKAREYVASLAEKYDTVGTSRPFDTTSGRTVYVYGSAYGWKIDQEAETEQLVSDIRNGVQTTREPIYSMRANSHGYNDFGDTYIEVDLSWQYMVYYRNGQDIMSSEIVSGLYYDPDRQTPPGVYTLYYKKSPEVLRGPQREDGTYEYETNVTFWMPFNGGIGFHDATWQPYFGGDRYLYGGSHGCINLPYDAAAYLYSIIDYGVPIICFY